MILMAEETKAIQQMTVTPRVQVSDDGKNVFIKLDGEGLEGHSGQLFLYGIGSKVSPLDTIQSLVITPEGKVEWQTETAGTLWDFRGHPVVSAHQNNTNNFCYKWKQH